METKPGIILAGGSGFIGTGLAPVLVANGHNVTVLTRGASHEAGGGG